MTTKLTKQERLYDVTQLAKAIFVESARHANFAALLPNQKEEMINSAFQAAEAFMDYQEQNAINT